MKDIEKKAIGLVMAYRAEHDYKKFPSVIRMSKATADEWFGVELDEQAADVRWYHEKALRVVIDNSMPKGELEVM